MEIIWHDAKHQLTIKRDEKHLYLFHRGEIYLHVNRIQEEIEILKKMYNRIVDNHYNLENYFEN